MENFVAIDIEDEIMEQEASTSNVDTYANYTAGILKGMGNMLAVGPPICQVPSAALSLCGEMLSSEVTEMKEEKTQEFEREVKTFIQETRQHQAYQVRFNNWMAGKIEEILERSTTNENISEKIVEMMVKKSQKKKRKMVKCSRCGKSSITNNMARHIRRCRA